MTTLLSIKKTYEKHRKENPASTLSERIIRQAVKDKRLPAIAVGSKTLLCYETFDKWLKGDGS